MKRTIFTFAILLGWACNAGAAEPAPLTTLHQIHALTNAEAARGIPVAFEATVTYYRGDEFTFFAQDGDAAIYIYIRKDLNLVPGDRVLVRGKTLSSFNPIVAADNVALLGHSGLPMPLPVNYDQLIRAETDCRLVTARGVVRTADFALSEESKHYVKMQLIMDGGYIGVNMDSFGLDSPEELLDDEVEITGVSSEEFDSKMHPTGVLMHIQSFSDLKILHRATTNPWAIPLTDMDRIISVSHIQDSTERIRVHGSITYYQPGFAVVLQNGENSIWISTGTHRPMRIGDAADATGFPDSHNGFLNLVHGEIRDTLISAPVKPLSATWKTLAPRGFDSPGHYNDLVSIEGQVVTEVREAAQDEFVLETEGKQFSALLRHPDGPLKDRREFPLGSRVRVTGICVLENSNPFVAQVPFNILLRTDDDIEVIQNPSLLSIRNLVIAVGLLFVIAVLAGARGWILERKVRQNTVALANRIEAEAALERHAALLEQKRSRILEHINGARPISETLEEIVALVSFTLQDAQCWCEVADGARLGDYPKDLNGLRIVQVKIDSRTGPSLGSFYAAIHSASPLDAAEIEALQTGARLATLAIETRKLYSDLRRRSEFDLLTDIPNRFAMERFIDAQIEEAKKSSGILGLIYIDLDNFKPINDTYGHHMGDLYLQDVARRMSRQLLGGDMLARLGGDEFAALVSLPHGRSDLERILARLEHCFAEPFTIGDLQLQGGASFGVALYPMDGVSRDSLLSSADAAMYAVKRAKRQAA